MIKKKVYITFLIAGLCALLLSFITKEEEKKDISFSLLNTQKEYTAGSPVSIVFKSPTDIPASLLLQSYRGSILVKGVYANKTISFNIPEFYAQKAGYISWVLIAGTKSVHKGSFTIIPGAGTRLENYLGPRSMPTGNGHYTMMVSIPTDRYDNPKPDNTPTVIKTQFLETVSEQNIPTKNFISWKRINSPEKAGKILTSVSCQGVETKETETDVYAGIPTNFKIDYTRNHNFADGNQATILSTSVIKDEFGNIAGDGTMVTFLATTAKGVILKTYGNTVRGVATAHILSPEHGDTYHVTAYINGMAESNTVTIKYEQIKTRIDYFISDDKRTITVGPVKSFMNQIAPDGTTVTLLVYKNNEPIKEIREYTKLGMAEFKLPEYYKKKYYSFTINVFGNTTGLKTLYNNAGK